MMFIPSMLFPPSSPAVAAGQPSPARSLLHLGPAQGTFSGGLTRDGLIATMFAPESLLRPYGFASFLSTIGCLPGCVCSFFAMFCYSFWYPLILCLHSIACIFSPHGCDFQALRYTPLCPSTEARVVHCMPSLLAPSRRGPPLPQMNTVWRHGDSNH